VSGAGCPWYLGRSVYDAPYWAFGLAVTCGLAAIGSLLVSLVARVVGRTD